MINNAFALFLDKYEAKYSKATECLEKDRDELLAFYDFPAEHWKHIRTTNPIESTFATDFSYLFFHLLQHSFLRYNNVTKPLDNI
ncbi:MAG: transposase [Alphaproteobacteria bacterium]|nr:transposase [Alphaproteobacteria bacterium]